MPNMLSQNKCLHTSIATVLIAIFVAGCNYNGQLSPEGYQLDKPLRTELGKALNEISGIWYSAQDSSLLAIADNKEKVYQIDLKIKKLKDYTDKVVNSNSNIEDIVKAGNSVFLLMSRGTLVEVPLTENDSVGITNYDVPLPQGKNDFEAVYHDPADDAILVLCKSCSFEKGTGMRSAFRFNLKTRSFDSSASFTISQKEVEALLKSADAKLDPSAAAIHPITKKLFILSSAGNLLVIANTDGGVLEAYKLDPSVFPQAEGIAFAPNGDMYISNEGKFGYPTLLHFAYNQNVKKK
jgi:uncharacterized protein YjiK